MVEITYCDPGYPDGYWPMNGYYTALPKCGDANVFADGAVKSKGSKEK